MTAPDLVVALRALLAEFRSPENRFWLTDACADRLEAVLTAHAPQETEPGPLGEAGARLRALVAQAAESFVEICRRIEAGVGEAETHRELSIARSKLLETVYAVAENAQCKLHNEMAELDALLSAPVVSPPQPKETCGPWDFTDLERDGGK